MARQIETGGLLLQPGGRTLYASSDRIPAELDGAVLLRDDGRMLVDDTTPTDVCYGCGLEIFWDHNPYEDETAGDETT